MKGQVLPEILAPVDVSVSSPLCHSQQHHRLFRKEWRVSQTPGRKARRVTPPWEGLSSTLPGTCLTPHLFLHPRCQPDLLSSGCSQALSAAQQSAGSWRSLTCGIESQLPESCLRGARNLSGTAVSGISSPLALHFAVPTTWMVFSCHKPMPRSYPTFQIQT